MCCCSTCRCRGGRDSRCSWRWVTTGRKAVVFVTAHDTYAIDAFEQHAVDYLLKPFDQRRFRVALGRVRERLGAATSDDRLDRLLKALAPRTEWLERIPAKVANRVTLVPVEEIDWIEAADNYVRLHTGDGQYGVRETMNNLSEQLDPRQFARVHRSTIVNLSRVKEMLALPSGDYTVVLEGGTRLTLSRGIERGSRNRSEGRWGRRPDCWGV